MSFFKNIIFTNRFIIRKLNLNDATSTYLSWFSDNHGLRFISKKPRSKIELEEYIQNNIEKEDTLFLGVFCLENGEHVGNIKFEKIDRLNGAAIVGFLIGNKEFRGKGVIYEVFYEVIKLLYSEVPLRTISLGLDCRNTAAFNLYKKMGFEEGPSELIPWVDDGHTTMNLDLAKFLAEK